MDSAYLLGTRIDATDYRRAAAQVLEWARASESRYVCAANVHMVMEAYDSPEFQRVVNGAGLVTPDGMPLVWYLRALGIPQQRVYGPDLMLEVCGEAARQGVPVGLFGATDATLDALAARLQERFQALRLAYRFAPPFRPMSPEEDREQMQALGRSGARILFVGLGCPKQERWMAAHQGQVPMPMLGVGAAFDFHAGSKRQAPGWMQRAGLEWAFRLAHEPRRMAGRYLRHNPRFLALLAKELALRASRRS